MKKFLVILSLVAAFLAVVIVSLGIFLAPDDLASCGAKPSLAENCQKADAIVAISGGDTTARTAAAVELYQNGWADTIIFSGAARDPDSESNAMMMQRQAVRAGVPATAILLDEAAKTTNENAQNVAAILNERQLNDVILTTSGYHMRRAQILFQIQFRGANAQIPRRDLRVHPAVGDGWEIWWLTPRGWWLSLSELVKICLIFVGLC